MSLLQNPLTYGRPSRSKGLKNIPDLWSSPSFRRAAVLAESAPGPEEAPQCSSGERLEKRPSHSWAIIFLAFNDAAAYVEYGSTHLWFMAAAARRISHRVSAILGFGSWKMKFFGLGLELQSESKVKWMGARSRVSRWAPDPGWPGSAMVAGCCIRA